MADRYNSLPQPYPRSCMVYISDSHSLCLTRNHRAEKMVAFRAGMFHQMSKDRQSVTKQGRWEHSYDGNTTNPGGLLNQRQRLPHFWQRRTNCCWMGKPGHKIACGPLAKDTMQTPQSQSKTEALALTPQDEHNIPPQQQRPCQVLSKALGLQDLVNLVHFVLQSYRNGSRCNMSMSHSSMSEKTTILKDTGKSLATCQDYEDQSKSEVPSAPETLGELELVLLLMPGTGSPSSCSRGAGKHVPRAPGQW